MGRRGARKSLSSFRIIIIGFWGLILFGTMLLMLPAAVRAGESHTFEEALFTATSAVCVTGLVIKDTATHWSVFGQAVILLLIQIGGLGIVTVAAFFATVSGRKISLLQRTALQDSISAHQVGGMVRMTFFIFKTAFCMECLGALSMMPVFCRKYGTYGIWMSVFHSVSAFCNAGFDIMGDKSGSFSSLTAFGSHPWIVVPVCLLIILGGIGFLTWNDITEHGLRVHRYRMQTKVILIATALLILLPAAALYMWEYAEYGTKERICLSLFQAVTPRTAGFNTADLTKLTSAGRMLIISLMLIGGSPGSTAGGMKTTTLAVLLANTLSVFRRRKSTQLLSRRVEEETIKSASTLLTMYLLLTMAGAAVISMTEDIPIGTCLFETASAIGTVGLSLGITPFLRPLSHLVLVLLMYFGRVGGLTLMYAAIDSRGAEVSQRPFEKITVG